MEKVSLSGISSEIKSYMSKPISKDEPTIVEVLTRACSLPSNNLRYLITKVVLVDQYLQANVIRYLSKPGEGKIDYRFGYYHDIAVSIKKLNLDVRIEEIGQKAKRLTPTNAYDVTMLVNEVSDVVKNVTGRTALVFASKLLHFCSTDLFPVLDQYAENELREVLSSVNEKDTTVIEEIMLKINRELLLELWWNTWQEIYNKYWHDGITDAELLKVLEENHPDKHRKLENEMGNDRYMLFVRDILCLQQAICSEGGPCFSLRELDKYLYGRDYLKRG